MPYSHFAKPESTMFHVPNVNLPLQINGDWRTLFIAADNVEKIEEGGELRAYIRHLECHHGCRNISVRFYVTKDGVCKVFTIVGVKDEARGVYVADYVHATRTKPSTNLPSVNLPLQIDGDWRSHSIAADKVEKIEDGGELRVYFRQLQCQDGCKNISIKFYVKKDGMFQEFTVVGVKDEARGVYVAEYSGKNYFSVVYNTEKVIIFHNINVDEAGITTNVILATGKRDSLTVEEQQKFAKVVQDYGIPEQNIRPVILTDTCPE
ncbi:Odorant-binding protein [Fukomys damarensis]|uniref:Odorant-binding protein n=1 Tax=Fukomys damarensis TaxID=885580 RepID=A0A091E196_FUKDA|nr:Odorant-binding protein [Fukomys damarensis]